MSNTTIWYYAMDPVHNLLLQHRFGITPMHQTFYGIDNNRVVCRLKPKIPDPDTMLDLRPFHARLIDGRWVHTPLRRIQE